MMLLVAGLLVWMTVAVVVAAPVETSSVAPETSEPAKCCFAQQFTATLGEMGGLVYPVTGNVVVLDGAVKIKYDYNLKRESQINTLKQPDGTYKTTFTLLDYENKVEYRAQEDGQCVTKRVEGEMAPPCIPQNATFLGNATIGSEGHTLKLNTWEFYMGEGDQAIRIHMAVTAKQCVPVFQTINGNIDGVDHQQTFFYTDYHPGIADGNALAIPADCLKAPSSEAVVG